MFKNALYLISFYYTFNSMFKLSEQTQTSLITVIDFINLLSAFNSLRSYVIKTYGVFDRRKYITLSAVYLTGAIIYRRIILLGDMNMMSWAFSLRRHVLLIIIQLIIPEVTPLQEKLVCTVGAFGSAIAYYNVLKGVKSVTSLYNLVKLITNLNISCYFLKNLTWMLDFIIFGKIYVVDYLVHWALNWILVLCALINNNSFTITGQHKDMLWYYLLFYFLFLNNHGTLIFKRKCYFTRSNKALVNKSVKSANTAS